MTKADASPPIKDTPATDVLAQNGLPYALHPIAPVNVTPAEDAADLGQEGGSPSLNRRSFKTLLVMAGDDLVSATLPRSAALDLAALAAAIGHHHAVLASPQDVARATAAAPDDASPLGLEATAWSVIDVSAMNLPSMLVASGLPNLDIEVLPNNLVNVLQARTAPIAQFS